MTVIGEGAVALAERTQKLRAESPHVPDGPIPAIELLEDDWLTGLLYKPGTKMRLEDCAGDGEVAVTIGVPVQDVDRRWWWALTRPRTRNYRLGHTHIPREATRAEAALLLHDVAAKVELHETDEFFRYADGTPVVEPNHDLEVTANCPTGRYPAYTGKCW